MMHRIFQTLLFVFLSTAILAQPHLREELPVLGFCIAAPQKDRVKEFVKFIDKELAPRHINTLILRVDFNYEFESHPELRDSVALSKAEVRKIVDICKKHDIELIPQINLLGHQSWANQIHNLLRVYPEFDETPHVTMPEEYEWPNKDGLYCKSYCPLHPDVHNIVFNLVDEICDVFEANAFHAGMDEVFYIGDDKCPRCGGRDKAELFAGEVSKISNHLKLSDRRLWIWGDRLLDGKTTGLGMWEASFNNTHRAIDMIPRDVVICDWHYERADQTPVYFAMKGFDVLTCMWREPRVGAEQALDMIHFRERATPEMQNRFKGIIQTVWSDTGTFLDGYYGKNSNEENTPWNTFKTVFQP